MLCRRGRAIESGSEHGRARAGREVCVRVTLLAQIFSQSGEHAAWRLTPNECSDFLE